MLEDNIFAQIKAQIETSLNEEAERQIQKLIEEMEYQLRKKKVEIVCQIADNISIEASEHVPSMEYRINISMSGGKVEGQ